MVALAGTACTLPPQGDPSNFDTGQEGDDSGTDGESDTGEGDPCGNGVIDPGEDCDDANDILTDDCVACVDAACGDGYKQEGVEDCEPTGGQDDVCPPMTCKYECGDGLRQPGEGCDKADDPDDLCNEDCTLKTCGNGNPDDDGEACDPDPGDPDEPHCLECQWRPGATAVAAGTHHTCALFHDGGVKCWGLNNKGQLGYPDIPASDSLFEPREDKIDFGPNAPRVIQLAAGQGHTCALFADETVRCWGNRSNGAIGPVTPQYDPAAVPPLTDIPLATISSSDDHVCGIASQNAAPERRGRVYCWGRNHEGQLGLGNKTQTNVGPNYKDPFESEDPTGLGSVVDVVAGHAHTCAIRMDNTVTCWGTDERGEPAGILGFGPPTVDDAANPCFDAGPLKTPAEAGCSVNLGGGTLLGIGRGRYMNCAATNEGGPKLRCWGSNERSVLGVPFEDTTHIHSPHEWEGLPLPNGTVQIKGFTLGAPHDFMAAVVEIEKVDQLWCWGKNKFYECGNGVANDITAKNAFLVPLPEQPIVSVASGFAHTCVVLQDGALYCWGKGDHGKLGYGTTDDAPYDKAVNLRD